MSNDALKTLVILAVLIEAAVLALTLLRKNLFAVVLLNAIVAVWILFFIVPDLIVAFKYRDSSLLVESLMSIFELAVLATSLLWFANRKGRHWLIWTEYSVHTLFSIAAMIFVLTFKITRLI